jgi:hypothetical protein
VSNAARQSSLRVVGGTVDDLLAGGKLQIAGAEPQAPRGRKLCPKCGQWRRYGSFFQHISAPMGGAVLIGGYATKTCGACRKGRGRSALAPSGRASHRAPRTAGKKAH